MILVFISRTAGEAVIAASSPLMGYTVYYLFSDFIPIKGLVPEHVIID